MRGSCQQPVENPAWRRDSKGISYLGRPFRAASYQITDTDPIAGLLLLGAALEVLGCDLVEELTESLDFLFLPVVADLDSGLVNDFGSCE